MDPRTPGADLDLAQRSLARAIGRARAGEDRELAQKVREQGEALAHQLAGVLKMSRVHSAENRAFDAPVESLARALAQLAGLLGPVHLAAVEDQVYVNEVRIRTEGHGSARDLGTELAKHNVGGLTFHQALDGPQIRALVAGFAAAPAPVAPRRELARALVAAGLTSVELAPRYRFRTQDEQLHKEGSLEALRRALRLVEETYENMASGRVLNALPLRRAVAGLLDGDLSAPELWAPMEGAPFPAHAATVALVAMLVGQRAGLDHGVLQDLGLAALLHDVGYAAVPAPAAGGPEGLGRHPAEGARLMLRQRGFHEGKLRRLRAVLDHHRDHVEPRGRPSVLGEVLRLAEDYATLCRVYAGRIAPCDALGAMAAAGGRLYHPVLAQLLVNALGRYPPGTLLELEDGRYARSVSPARSPATFATPLVRTYDLRTRALTPELTDLAKAGAVRRALPG